MSPISRSTPLHLPPTPTQSHHVKDKGKHYVTEVFYGDDDDDGEELFGAGEGRN